MHSSLLMKLFLLRNKLNCKQLPSLERKTFDFLFNGPALALIFRLLFVFKRRPLARSTPSPAFPPSYLFLSILGRLFQLPRRFHGSFLLLSSFPARFKILTVQDPPVRDASVVRTCNLRYICCFSLRKNAWFCQAPTVVFNPP